MMNRSFVICFLLVIFVVGVSSKAFHKEEYTQQKASDIALQKKALSRIAVANSVTALMNDSVSPCEDFFEYACGKWISEVQIPAGRNVYSLSFTEIIQKNDNISLSIVRSNKPLVSDFYASCMDAETIESLGLAPLTPWLQVIDNIQNLSDLMKAFVTLRRNLGATPFFSFHVGADVLNPQKAILHFGQNGAFSLPTKAMYMGTDAKNRAIRQAYVTYLSDSFVELGIEASEASTLAEQVVALEKELALETLAGGKKNSRDPHNSYNPYTVEQLEKEFVDLPWKDFFGSVGNSDIVEVNLRSVGYFQAMTRTVATTPMKTIKAYLYTRVLRSSTGRLPKKLKDMAFAFFSTRLEGTKAPIPEWERCVTLTSKSFSELMGRYFLEESGFKQQGKDVAEKIVIEIEKSFEERLQKLEWMDAKTREKALQKLHAVSNMIGYPSKFDDFATVKITPTGFFDNEVELHKYEYDQMIKSATLPIDMGKWDMRTSEVNAYYSITKNTMVFPAGILQPPFFSAKFPAAMNFGGIGMVVGHELTHGFDDKGSQFNREGKMEKWWETETLEQFRNHTKCLSRQYSSYQPYPGHHINGAQTIGETLADLGGVTLAYQTYKRRHEQDLSQRSIVKTLTNEQLFFLSFAQAWCAKENPEYAKLKLKTETHPPHKYRVIGTLSNIPEFSKAFKCPAGSTMNPAHKCQVW